MIRNRNVMLLLFVFWLPLLSFAVEDGPPSSAVIYQTLERLWGGRQYAETDKYVRDLQSKWGDYVPVELTLAIYSYKYGAQVEDAIERLKRLREKLNADISAASPMFMDELDSRIIRYQKAQEFYLQQGISREQRLAQRNPLKKTAFKHSRRWGGVDESLYFNAPELFLAESGVRAVGKERATAIDSSLEQVPVNTLQSVIENDRKPMAERKAFARELVRRRGVAGGVSNLVQSLREGDSLYTYQYTVEALARVGPAAIPELIKHIHNPALFPDDQRMAIWVLVRIGVADPAVIETLQTISSNSDRTALVRYAQDALRYLQRRRTTPH